MGFDIWVMTYEDTEHRLEFEQAGINIIDFHPEKKFNRQEVRRIRKAIIENEIDILHLFNNRAIVNGILAARGLPVKVVLYRGYAGNIHWYDPTAYIKFLHPRVDRIVCNAKGVEEVIQKQLFFDKRKTITINKGHDVAWYEGYEPYDIRKELGLDADAFLFVNVANNRRMKGIPYLLQAFNDLPDNLPIHLLLVGRGMDNDQNLKIIGKGNKKKQIHILGFRQNALNIVSACNAFVLSSIKGESLTRALVEAMSLQIPSILTDIPGNRGMAIDGESGLIVPSKDSKSLMAAMLRLYQDKQLQEKLSQNSKQRIASHFSYQRTREEMKAFYTELMTEKA